MFMFPCFFSLWEKFPTFGMTFQVLYSIIVNQKQRKFKLRNYFNCPEQPGKATKGR